MTGISSWAWLAASAGMIAAMWGRLQSFGQWLASLAIVTVTVEDDVADVLVTVLHRDGEPSRFFRWVYRAINTPDTATGRWFTRPYKALVRCSGCVWYRGRPVWIGAISGSGEAPLPGAGSPSPSGGSGAKSVRLSFVRGSLDIDRLITDSFASRTAIALEGSGRFRVKRVTGTAGSRMGELAGMSIQNQTPPQPDVTDEGIRYGGIGPVGWTFDDAKPRRTRKGSYVLSGDLETALDELRRWLSSEDWYRERGIPWRRGIALSGAPGTGKTSFVRHIGESLDLPVYLFDLATLRNRELIDEWRDAMSHAPCVVLFEDVDAVFNGRDNVSGIDGGPTFDCLLNCIDGVERGEGVIVAVTTNRLEMLDRALLRPGRVDRIATVGAFDAEGRRRMAARILADLPDARAAALTEGDARPHVTPAEFQEVCMRLALDAYWSGGGKANGAATQPHVAAPQ